MNYLTPQGIERLSTLILKIRERKASSSELNEFVQLINKGGTTTEQEITAFLTQAGFNSLEELSKHIQDKRSEEFINALITIGMGILLGYALSRLLRE